MRFLLFAILLALTGCLAVQPPHNPMKPKADKPPTEKKAETPKKAEEPKKKAPEKARAPRDVSPGLLPPSHLFLPENRVELISRWPKASAKRS
jgi:hypothetical protein